MLVILRVGSDAGKTVDVRPDIARLLIADGRAEDPYAEPERQPAVETEMRKPETERAVKVQHKHFRR